VVFLCVESDRSDDRKRDQFWGENEALRRIFHFECRLLCFVSMCGVVSRIVAYQRRRDSGGGGGTFLHSRVQFGMTALMPAASNGHADCARLLLDAGADKEAKDKVRDSADSVRVCLRAHVLCWWDGDE
jgi:hypothetical protein